jgi:hypothetical protein
MIHGMTCRENIILRAVTSTLWVAGLLCVPVRLSAGIDPDPSVSDESVPSLTIRVFGFAGLNAWVLEGAEAEAGRMLRGVSIHLSWLDCTPRVIPASCLSPQLATDLIVRFIPKALPQASKAALGIAAASGDYGTAFVFYDRVLALRTHTRVLPDMLGRVIAHEITHLLLPDEGHSDLGLMRGLWAAGDLQITSSACLGLSPVSIHFMKKAALQRMLHASSSVKP